MKKVVILGAGAHAAEIEGYILDNNKKLSNRIDIVGYYDDNTLNWSNYQLKSPLLGGIMNYKLVDDIELIIGVANIQVRQKLIAYYLGNGARFTNFIHYSSFVFDTAKIGIGNVICRNCVIGPNVSLGDFNILNTNSSLGHDSIVGDNNVLCPNVGFSGSTIVADDNFFSLNATTIPKVNIGSRNIIAPNMVLDKNVKNDTTVFHRFKEKVLYQPK